MKRLALLPVVFALALTGCNRTDGDRLARVAARLTQHAQSLVPDRTPFGSPIGLAKNTNVEERVRERFKTDRYLTGLPIEVAGQEDSVRLIGQVNDPQLKSRAVEIAESTVGVEKVIDEIVVAK
jgi:hyperosmotically inducible periplasmic protein